MRPLRTLSPRIETLVDHHGFMVIDPTDRTVLGVPAPDGFNSERLVYALPTNITGGLSRRYQPPKDPDEVAVFGINFDAVVPLGLGILSGTLSIQTNAVPPADASSDWSIGAVTVRGRALYATLGGGVAGTDYQLVWTATDSDQNIWPRTGLVLCAATS